MAQPKIHRGNGMRPNFEPRIVPKHVQSEANFIGGILARNSNYDELPEDLRLTRDNFSDPVLAQIWDWMTRMLNAGKPADIRSLAPAMESLSKLPTDHERHLSLEEAESYLEDLTVASSVIALPKMVIGHARIVRDYSSLRTAQEVGQDLVDKTGAATPDIDPSEVIGTALDRLSRIQSIGAVTGHMTLDQAMAEAIEMTEQAQLGLIGISTGLPSLDKRIGGLQNGTLYVGAGRPSMGKTAGALQIALNAALVCQREGRGIAVFASYEMAERDLARRILANEASMPIDRQIASKLAEPEHERRVWDLRQAAKRLQGIPLKPGFHMPKNIHAFSSYVKRMHREEGGVRMLAVDYLQLMSGNAKDRVQEVSEISKGLKTLATDLDIPILALSQLSRKLEERPDKRPMLSDLRESGSIEQDADVVWFYYREDYYLERIQPQGGADYDKWLADMDRVKGKAELIVAKLRQGEIGTIHLEYEGKYFLFKEPANTPAKVY